MLTVQIFAILIDIVNISNYFAVKIFEIHITDDKNMANN
jgi:hypothetical protein